MTGSNKRVIALHWGSYQSHLDAIAAIAGYFDLPLFVTDEKIFDLVMEKYPSLDLSLLSIDLLSEGLKHLPVTILCSLPEIWIKRLFPSLDQPQFDFIFCPHGFVEEGHQLELAQSLSPKERVLSYGELMSYHFIKKGVQPHQLISVGAIRHAYFQQSALFYERLYQKLRLPKDRKVFLFAPGVSNGGGIKKLMQVIDGIEKRLPSNALLLVKFHPYNCQREILKKESKPSLQFLEEFFPPIALFPHIDGLISDHSSLIYDFIPFHKPIILIKELQKRGKFAFSDLVISHSCNEGAIFDHEWIGREEKNRARMKLLFDLPVSQNLHLGQCI